MSLPSRTRVWETGSSLPGLAGSGICFTQTATFMARLFFTRTHSHHSDPRPAASTGRGRARGPPATTGSGGGEGTVGRRGVVKAQGGTTAQGAKQNEVRLAVPAMPEF